MNVENNEESCSTKNWGKHVQEGRCKMVWNRNHGRSCPSRGKGGFCNDAGQCVEEAKELLGRAADAGDGVAALVLRHA